MDERERYIYCRLCLAAAEAARRMREGNCREARDIMERVLEELEPLASGPETAP